MKLVRMMGSFAAVATMVLLGGCGSGNNDKAQLRIAHAAFGAPAVNATVGSDLISTLSYKQATSYFERKVGNNALLINVASSGANIASLSPNLPLEKDKRYSAVAIGSLAANTLEALLVIDAADAPAANQLKLRLIHASPAVGAVDVYLTAPTIDLLVATPAASFQYKDIVPANGANALQVVAGNYRVRLTPKGSKQVVFDSGTLALAAAADLQLLAVPNSVAGANSPISILALTTDDRVFEISDTRTVAP
jgi:hypothetical protein